jgi:hypothetical protein
MTVEGTGVEHYHRLDHSKLIECAAAESDLRRCRAMTCAASLAETGD